MSPYKIKKIEMDLLNFITKGFEKPNNCKDVDQIRFYIRELCLKIEEYEKQFNYVPDWAYSLLAQYNNVHNNIANSQFTQTYSLI